MKEFYQLLLCYQRLGWDLPRELRHIICQILLKDQIKYNYMLLHPTHTAIYSIWLNKYLNQKRTFINTKFDHDIFLFIGFLAMSIFKSSENTKIAIFCKTRDECDHMARFILSRIGNTHGIDVFSELNDEEYNVYLYVDVIPTEHHRVEFILYAIP